MCALDILLSAEASASGAVEESYPEPHGTRVCRRVDSSGHGTAKTPETVRRGAEVMTCDTSLCRACRDLTFWEVPKGTRRSRSCLECLHADPTTLDAGSNDNKANHGSCLEPLAQRNNGALQRHLCEHTHSNMRHPVESRCDTVSLASEHLVLTDQLS